jgi:hypothetical protein
VFRAPGQRLARNVQIQTISGTNDRRWARPRFPSKTTQMPTVEELRETYTSTLFIPHRNELLRLLNSRKLLGCGVEIGVKQGEFSEILLDSWRGRLLLSVDPWREDAPEAYVDIANVPQMQQDIYCHESCARLARFGSRSSICRMTSVEAAAAVIDYTMDFVYIDARRISVRPTHIDGPCLSWIVVIPEPE